MTFASSGVRVANAVRTFARVVIPAVVTMAAFGQPTPSPSPAPSAPPPTASLLARIRDVAGGDAWWHVGVLQVDGRLVANGLEARFTASEDTRTGRADRRRRFALYAEREVWDGFSDWRQDRSGGVHRLDGAFATKRSVTDAWLTSRGWLRANAGGAFVAPVTIASLDGRTVFRMTAIPHGGQLVTLSFDAGSLDLVLTERVMPTTVVQTRYDDWRTVGGVRLPFSIAIHEDDTETFEVAHYALDARPDPATFHRPVAPHDWTMDGPSVTVPMDLRNGALTIDARIDGQGPYRFILDTGGHAILSPALAAALRLDVVGNGVSGGAGESTLVSRDTRVTTLEIGGLTLHDQHFYVLDLGYPTFERGEGPPLGGLLGVELLERFAVRFDYPHRTVRFAPFDHRHVARPGAPFVAPLRFDDDIPLVDATLDGRPGVFALDTGNSGTLVVQSTWAERTGLAATLKAGLETASFGAGGLSRNWIGRVDTFTVGGHAIDRPLARYAEDRRGAFSSRTEAGNIGTQILAHYVIDFDYDRGRVGWRFVPGYVPPPFNRAGLRLLKTAPDSLVVVVAAERTPAARAGLAPKDRIVAIDGRPARSWSGADVAEVFAQPVGTIVRLSVERGDTRFDRTILLEDVVP